VYQAWYRSAYLVYFLTVCCLLHDLMSSSSTYSETNEEFVEQFASSDLLAFIYETVCHLLFSASQEDDFEEAILG
jgi:hypothetical protein